MSIYEKLMLIQNELKCPKGQFNSFGKYYYRSTESILEGLKPLLLETKTVLKISDSVEHIGDRYYIKATAELIDCESESIVSNTALAREEETKKDMDGSQITGTASSYARKYALNGLFAIDDTKDADTDQYAMQSKATESLTKVEVSALEKLLIRKGVDVKTAYPDGLNMNRITYMATIKKLEKMPDKE